MNRFMGGWSYHISHFASPLASRRSAGWCNPEKAGLLTSFRLQAPSRTRAVALSLKQ